MNKEEMLLQEYRSYMTHLVEIRKLRYILVGLNITALGTLISLTITRTQDAVLLLTIMSFVSSILGIVWVGECLSATRSMNQVRDKIIPHLSLIYPDIFITSPFDYHERTNLKLYQIIIGIFTGKAPSAATGLFLFFLPSVSGWLVALVLAIKNSELYWYFYILTSFSFFLLFILGAGFINWYKEWIKENQAENKEQPN